MMVLFAALVVVLQVALTALLLFLVLTRVVPDAEERLALAVMPVAWYSAVIARQIPSHQTPTALGALAVAGAATLALPRSARVSLLAASVAQYVAVCGLLFSMNPGPLRRGERVEASAA